MTHVTIFLDDATEARLRGLVEATGFRAEALCSNFVSDEAEHLEAAIAEERQRRPAKLTILVEEQA
ncbi:hypothetical protein [Rhizobium sp. 9140]|uniref:hypothetical protein n=1 Tax=Rhizobium sp. 9140 TaxID=1761900 RepID=UPI000799B53A|nr:hypothetical protein [Rhizobium sp. 9140]CZT36164.1 hypothetical protein GA0004734_00031660 [Rhizobium sp. 9140]